MAAVDVLPGGDLVAMNAAPDRGGFLQDPGDAAYRALSATARSRVGL